MERFMARFNFHPFENLKGGQVSSSKIDPTEGAETQSLHLMAKVLTAAACGDLQQIICYVHEGADVWGSDYDERTALHLAASEGQEKVLLYLLKLAKGTIDPACFLSPRDRWDRTPLDDAMSGGHDECAKHLKESGAIRGDGEKNKIKYDRSSTLTSPVVLSPKLLARMQSGLSMSGSPTSPLP